ncbi:MAG: hypothetical protein E6K54_03300 [Gammaproteobacteria bacterium]|nr:MAG: hypothetical protein E6K54_03300 [Gammaproteobacteria bacterium]
MDNISDQALPETSFEFSHYNQDKIIISFGPKNGFLWRGEAFDEKKHLIEGLNKVFTEGFAQGDEQSILANLDYIKQNYPDFICASNTYCNEGEFTGLEHEDFSAGTYGYVYLIDTSKKNIQSIPLCEQNLFNSVFVANYTEVINEGPDYAIISKAGPECIIGARPSAFVAYALGIKETTFIMNPIYQGILHLGEINKFAGTSKFYTLSTLALKYPDLPIEEIYKNYLKADEKAMQSDAASCAAPNVTFFNRLSSESEYIQKHTPSSNYNTSM